MGTRLDEAAMDYLRRIGTSGGSGLDVPADLQRTFHEQTGTSFARWCYAARMRIARDMLAGGAKPSAVSRRVGYAHLPTSAPPSPASTDYRRATIRSARPRKV
ncbi:hypothetical protein GCM10020369_37120 [Cryptosporangium minutisporangium]|uniref:HTH araC/xylS-type domain-containing protein n=1 Tax=Cryptosporangium minutisporangium TaxID=113569 RepID=A0ABP6SZT4_9ACTN